MKYYVSLFVLLSLIVLTGCKKGDGNIFVTGTINLEGSPLEGASVIFTAAEGSSGEDASGKTDETGKYVLQTVTGRSGSGTKPGEYRVSVVKKNIEHTGRFINRPGQDPVEDVIITDILHKEYSSYSTTPLRATVTNKKEDNVINFDLKQKP